MSSVPSPDPPQESPVRTDAAINALRRELASHPKVPPRRKPILPTVLAVLVSGTALAAAVWAVRFVDWEDLAARTGLSSAASADEAATAAEDSAAASASKGTRAAAAAKTTAGRDPNAAATDRPLAGSGPSDVAAVADVPTVAALSADQTIGVSTATPVTAPGSGPRVASATTALVDETIYSEQDRDVIPPRTSEKLPGPAIKSWTTRSNTMEVIVSRTGSVERVRLVSPMQGMNDMVVLGWAKNWTFTPAMKDGTPVRYRLLMTWEMNP